MKEDAYKHVTLTFGLLLFAVIGLWLYSRYSEIRTAVIERKKAETAAYIKSHVSAMVDPAVISGGDSIQQRQGFQSFFDSIQFRESVNIKIWDRDFKVVWSNLGELVGQRFPANGKVREALGGDVEFGIERQKAENLSESQDHEISATYVPIQDASGEIVGVVEVYQAALTLYGEIRTEFHRAALPVGAFMFIGYGGLVLLLQLLMAPKNLGVGENPI